MVLRQAYPAEWGNGHPLTGSFGCFYRQLLVQTAYSD
jgi:hypothetical protein